MDPNQIPFNRTKIVATLGPASSDPAVMRRMVQAGLDVFRLNFAHGTYPEFAGLIARVREVSRRLSHPVGILQDLPGPKLRVGALSSDVELHRGDDAVLVAGRTGPAGTIPVTYPELSRDLKPGHEVFIADGLIRLLVRSVKGGRVLCRVANGGTVRRGNGVNLPRSPLSLRAFTLEDARHLVFGLAHGVDFVGISFVGTKEDVDRVRAFCRRRGRAPFLIAKIERRLAVENLDDILESADGIMVARGDLGVEFPFFKVPGLQEDIVARARGRGRPVIVATQMLESMIQNPRPTRAEATDVATAAREGADAVMLSGETAVGKYPVAAVEALRSVIGETERRVRSPEDISGAGDLSDAVAREACRVAASVGARWIVVPTRSGATAARVSHHRPDAPILALTADEGLRRRFSLYWGLDTGPLPAAVGRAGIVRRLLARRVVKTGQLLVFASGAPGFPRGVTNLIHVVRA